MDVILPSLEISVGDNFELGLEFVNHSVQTRTVEAYVSGSVVYYTGVSGNEFLFKSPTVSIQAQKSVLIIDQRLMQETGVCKLLNWIAMVAGVKELVTIESRDYMDHLVEQANFNFIVTGKIKETGHIVTAMKVVTLHNPKLTVEV